jgi:hypothetical protein
VATIANAAVLLVSLGWRGIVFSEATWAALIIFVGFIIGATTMLKNRDIAYGLVIVWAYAGILLKHLSSEGFGGQYSTIIASTTICIFLLLLSAAYILISKKKKMYKQYGA